jgi:hypothetical protein
MKAQVAPSRRRCCRCAEGIVGEKMISSFTPCPLSRVLVCEKEDSEGQKADSPRGDPGSAGDDFHRLGNARKKRIV